MAQCSGSLGDDIAGQVINKFHSLPPKGKPTLKSNGVQEWTVLAGIVALHSDGSSSDVSIDTIAITTGVKSLPNDLITKSHGKLLHDCHAEILAIRAFNRFLVDECLKIANGNHSEYLKRTEDGKFLLKDGIEFGLYVSEPPCGDCSLELLYDENEPDWVYRDENGILNGVIRGREDYKNTGKVRTKPGRRDSPITLSKSCSDKLTICQLKSLLNGLSSLIIDPTAMYLKYIVVPNDGYDRAAFQRCFEDRFRPIITDSIYKLNYFDILTTELRHGFSKGSTRTPSPTSLVYLCCCNIQESIQKGIKEGFYSKKQYVRPNGESVLSRYQLLKQIQPLLVPFHNSYIECKESNTLYASIKKTSQNELGDWCKTATDDCVLVT